MSSFDTPWFNASGSGFFSHLAESKNKHIIISGETDDFAQEVINQWQSCGFVTHYVGLQTGGEEYLQRIRALSDKFGMETFAIVAFGDAAAVILQSFTRPRMPRLVAIVAYYPSSIPEPTISYPASIRVIVHLADDEINVKHHPEVLGIRSNKTKATRKRVDSGTGYGGRLQLGFRSYTYNDCESGFAEHDLDDYNAMAEDLAFSRSLAVIKQAFHLDNDIELIRDTTVDAAIHDDVEEVLDNLSEDCVLINAPVLTGGNGVPALRQYYAEMFSGLPPSFTAKLISRTIGSDRIVDEVLLDFDHTQPIPWLLPDVPASGRHVKIVLISITSIRGEKIVEEHTYWDQASLLLQIGLLDPRFVPGTWKDKGITKSQDRRV